MSVLTVIILIFSVIGAVDLIIGNKLGVGKEFERAFSLFCPMAMTMLGMIVIAPAVGVWLTPFFDGFYRVFGIDPSILPASVFANDMGGMGLSQSVCKDAGIGNFNAFVVSSMMGCVISFTIPFSLGLVKKEQHKELFFGLLCGIVTVPVGSFVGGLLSGVGFMTLYGFVLNHFFALNANLLIMAVYGLVGAIVTMLGDLSFSLIKRQYGIKDYGTLIPGHGGMLDRFDSMSFAAPTMYLLVTLLPAL